MTALVVGVGLLAFKNVGRCVDTSEQSFMHAVLA